MAFVRSFAIFLSVLVVLCRTADAGPLRSSIRVKTGPYSPLRPAVLRYDNSLPSAESFQIELDGHTYPLMVFPDLRTNLMTYAGPPPADDGSEPEPGPGRPIEFSLNAGQSIWGSTFDPNKIVGENPDLGSGITDEIFKRAYLSNIVLDLQPASGPEHEARYAIGNAVAEVSLEPNGETYLIDLRSVRRPRALRGVAWVVIHKDRLEPVYELPLREDPTEDRSHPRWVVSAASLERAAQAPRTRVPMVEIWGAAADDLFQVSSSLHAKLSKLSAKQRLMVNTRAELTPSKTISVPIRLRPWKTHPTIASRVSWLYYQLLETLHSVLMPKQALPTEFTYTTRGLFGREPVRASVQEGFRNLQRADDGQSVRDLLNRELPRVQSAREFLYLVLPRTYSTHMSVYAQQAARHLDHFFSTNPTAAEVAALSSYLPLSARAKTRLYETFRKDLNDPKLLTKFFAAHFYSSVSPEYRDQHDKMALAAFADGFEWQAFHNPQQVLNFAFRCLYEHESRFLLYGMLFEFLPDPREIQKWVSIKSSFEWELVFQHLDEWQDGLEILRDCGEAIGRSIAATTRAGSEDSVNAVFRWAGRAVQLRGSDEDAVRALNRMLSEIPITPVHLVQVVEGLRGRHEAQRLFVWQHANDFFVHPPSPTYAYWDPEKDLSELLEMIIDPAARASVQDAAKRWMPNLNLSPCSIQLKLSGKHSLGDPTLN